MSKFFIEQSELIKGVQKAYPVTTDNALESFNTFQLKLVDDLLFIASTDCETTFITEIPVVLEDIEFTEITLDSEYFLNIVRNLPENSEVEFIITDKNLYINCQDFEITIQAYEGDKAELYTGIVDYSKEFDDIIDSKKLEYIFDNLMSVANKSEGFITPAILINNNLAYATDGHTLSVAKIETQRNYVFSIKVAQCISTIIKNSNSDKVSLKYIEDDSAVLVKIGDDTFYFRNIVFDFDTIPIDSLTEELNELKSVVLLEKNQIIKLINRISAGRMVKSIELEIKSEIPNASIKFKCHDSIMKSSEIVKAKAKNVIDVAISLDFDSLLQAIKQIPTKEFIVKYSNNNNKLAIISSDKEIISLIPTN